MDLIKFIVSCAAGVVGLAIFAWMASFLLPIVLGISGIAIFIMIIFFVGKAVYSAFRN